MKRLVRYPVEASITDMLSRLLRRFLIGAEDAFEVIESWATKPTEDDPEPEKDVPEHFILDIMPVNDDEDWKTGPVFKLLVKLIGKDDEDVSVRLTMKPGNHAKGEQVTDTATYALIEEDESKTDANERITEMLDEMGTKLLKKSSKGKYDGIADVKYSS